MTLTNQSFAVVRHRPVVPFVFLLILAAFVPPAKAQPNLLIYNGYLVNGVQNWSWAAVNLYNTSPVYTNSHSISVTDGPGYQALYLEHPPFNTTPFSSIDFWINGGSTGGQKLQVTALVNGNGQSSYSLGTLQTNVWQHFTIPLSSLGVAGNSNCTGFSFKAPSPARSRCSMWTRCNCLPRRRPPWLMLVSIPLV